MEFNLVTEGFGPQEKTGVSRAAESAFETEGFACGEEAGNGIELGEVGAGEGGLARTIAPGEEI